MKKMALLAATSLFSCSIWAQNEPDQVIIIDNQNDIEITEINLPEGEEVIIEEIIDLRIGDVPEVDIDIEIDEDVKAEEAKKAYLGVTIHHNNNGQVEIEEVAKGSPAEASGLTIGDVIIDINGITMESSSQLVETIQSHEGGEQITMKIQRGGETIESTPTLALKAVEPTYTYHYHYDYSHKHERKAPEVTQEEACEMVEKMEGRPMLGVYVGSYSPNADGAKVSGVIEGRGAEDAGMADGDKIIAINRVDVQDSESLKDVLQLYAPGDKVRVHFMRDGQKMTKKVVLTSWSEVHNTSYNRYKSICEESIVQEEEEVAEEANAMQSGATTELISELNLSLELYPNPANQVLQIDFKGEEAPLSLSIVSVDGRVVYNEVVNEATGIYQKALDVSTYPAGAYFVNINQGDIQISEQLILNRE